MDILEIERQTIWNSILAGRPGPVRIVGGPRSEDDDLHTVSVLLDRYIAERRRHFEPEIGEAWQPDDWRQRLRERFPAMDAGYDHGPGWADLLAAGAQMCDDGGEPLRMSYAKEKWGRLSLFVSSVMPIETMGIDDAMETLSEHICEECGAPGRNRAVRGWWRTTCDRHAEGQR